MHTKNHKLLSSCISSHSYKVLIIILLLHVSYSFIYWQKEVTLFAGLAIFIFIAALFLLRKLRGQKDDILFELNSVIKKISLSSGVLIIIFFIPVIFTSAHQIVFWKFNAIGKITIAWLIFSAYWLNLLEKESCADKTGIFLSTPAVLFIVWSSILWISLVWDVGAYTIFKIATSSESGLNRLSAVIFRIWEDYPISSHFWLGFLSYDDFKNYAYANHSQAYLISTYLFVKLFQNVLGISLVEATRLLPILYTGFIVCTIIFVFFRTNYHIAFNKLTTQLMLFLCLGFFLTLPDFWITMLKYNADNPTPLIMCLMMMLFTYVIQDNYDAVGFRFLLYLICLSFYVLGTICLVTLVFFMFRRKVSENALSTHTQFVKTLAIGFALVLISALYPKIITMYLGYKDVASSFLFRSGLDGDMTYYSNIFQAVINPYSKQAIRPWSSLLPALIFAISIFVFSRLKSQERNLGSIEDLIFLFSPYLFLIVFFPQASSIHPYHYDYFFIFPLLFLSMCWSIENGFQQKIMGPKAYLLILFMSALVIYNLTKIAQFVRYM